MSKKTTKPKTVRQTKKSPKSSSIKNLTGRMSNILLPKKLLAIRTNFLARRPHRSFKRTKRRDYSRSLKLPGYFAFTIYVIKTLLSHRRIYLKMAVILSIASALLMGFGSQASFNDFIDSLEVASESIFDDGAGLDGISKAGVLVLAGVTGKFNPAVTETQQLYGVIVLLITWLTTVWLLRSQLAGNIPKMRDGLYSAGAPIVATFAVFVLVLLQLLPAGLGVSIYTAAISTGLLSNPVYSILAFFIVLLLFVLSLYLLVSTFFALVVVTLPGMYPWRAVRIAGDLVVGRRLRILYRLVWCFFAIIVGWIIVLVPLVFVAYLIHSHATVFDWIPIVPAALVILPVLTTIFSGAYIYLLYRKVVDDDASPA